VHQYGNIRPESGTRTAMATRSSFPGAGEFVPASHALSDLAAAAAGCRGCDLYANATQTVFGKGDRTARLMLVGEQPGDIEDVEGEPFVGPAGRLLEDARHSAGIADTPYYVTNAVKHFKFKAVRGSKRRIHDKPSAAQSTACRPWLAAELVAVSPSVVVALGATAAGSLFGPAFRLTQHRGEVLTWPPPAGPFAGDNTPVEAALATLHPSAVLRAQPEDRQAYYDGLVADLRLAAALLG
jgi:uracil-DNA glycosylase